MQDFILNTTIIHFESNKNNTFEKYTVFSLKEIPIKYG